MAKLTEDGKYTQFEETDPAPRYGGPIPWQSYRFCVECGAILAESYTDIHTDWHRRMRLAIEANFND